ncbi:MAG: peptidylprolyl isomerase [Planctomycetota bacterium]
MPSRRRFTAFATLVAALPCQERPSAPAGEPAAGPVVQQAAPAPGTEQHFIQLRYPRDREYHIASVDGLPVWLAHLVQHIDERHFPGFEQLMSGPDGKGSPDGKRFLESDLIAPWVRHFADIRALEKEAHARGDIDQERLDACLANALKLGFERHLELYVEDMRQRGLPTELDQDRVNGLLSDYQLRSGLACELQGWLDYLQPDEEWPNGQLNEFFQRHPRYFGGGVKIAHILIQNRDAGTGILLKEAGRIRAANRLAEVRAQLKPDGSNFGDVARRFSDDTRTGRDGGLIEYVERFDGMLPAALCRAAWTLGDGETSDVIETRYGWHIVHRIEHVQRVFMLFSEDTLQNVENVLIRKLQEDLLFRVRAEHAVELKL